MMSVQSLLARLKGHFQEYVARYSVLALAVLVPLSGALGSVAADLGGADTSAGRLAVAASSALGTAIAGVTFIRNLGIWQMLDKFGTAPGVGPGLNQKPDTTLAAGGDLNVASTGSAPAEAGGSASATAVGAATAPADIGSSPESPPDEPGAVPGVPDEDAQQELEATDGLESGDSADDPAPSDDPADL